MGGGPDRHGKGDGAVPAFRSEVCRDLCRRYGRTFGDIEAVLREAQELDFYCLMHSTEETLQGVPQQKTTVKLNAGLVYQMVNEFTEAGWSAFLCLQNGFAGQSRVVLRGAFEKAVQFFYLSLLQGDRACDRRISCLAEDGEFDLMAESLRSLLSLRDESLSRRLGRLHRSLCQESRRKAGLDVRVRLPWSGEEGAFFDPAAVLHVKGLLFSLFDLVFRLTRMHLESGRETVWRAPALQSVSGILRIVGKYHPTLYAFDRGFLVFREEADVPSGARVVYSVGFDGQVRYDYGTRSGLGAAQLKKLEAVIRRRLLSDSY
ncbi:MAG: hypothetical protein Kow0025_06220 [Thermodesulfovibrionales bacterium]